MISAAQLSNDERPLPPNCDLLEFVDPIGRKHSTTQMDQLDSHFKCRTPFVYDDFGWSFETQTLSGGVVV